VSFMGYQSEYISSFNIDKELKIYLKPAGIVLKEVVVLKDKFTRRQKLQLFREQFPGLTTSGKSSKIKNEEDISFKYDKTNYTLKAYSDRPLIILNPFLGYKIEYDLVSFEVKFSRYKVDSNYVVTSYYKGFSFVEEIGNSKEIVLAREKAFRGSEINFFRNLKNNVLGKDKFLLMANNNRIAVEIFFKIDEDRGSAKIEVISQQNNPKNLEEIASLDVVYNKNEYSNITFETKDFNIYKYENYSNIKNIVLTGKFAENRMGDMLPLNYNME
jgi:hypothetical protein